MPCNSTAASATRAIGAELSRRHAVRDAVGDEAEPLRPDLAAILGQFPIMGGRAPVLKPEHPATAPPSRVQRNRPDDDLLNSLPRIGDLADPLGEQRQLSPDLVAQGLAPQHLQRREVVLQAGDGNSAGLGDIAVAGSAVAAEDHHLGRGVQDLAPVVARRAPPARHRRHGRHEPEYRGAGPGSAGIADACRRAVTRPLLDNRALASPEPPTVMVSTAPAQSSSRA